MQDSKSGLGGLTGGTTMSAFGANTDKALVKATGFAGGLFFILVIVILLANKDSGSGAPSLMPAAVEKVTAPTAVMGEPAKASEAKPKAAASKGTTVTVPLSSAKEAPAAKPEVEVEAKPEAKAVTPAEPAKK